MIRTNTSPERFKKIKASWTFSNYGNAALRDLIAMVEERDRKIADLEAALAAVAGRGEGE